MPVIYDLFFFIFSILMLPVYIAKRKFHRGFQARLGIMPARFKAADSPLWVHAVSVGEVIAIKGLLEELRKYYPDKGMVISTVTPTGNKIARNLARSKDLVTYLPFDISFIVGSVIDRIKPSAFVIAETELWPNLITCLYKRKVPACVVNARISDRSFKGYMAVKFLLKPLLNKIKVFCVQTPRDAERLKSLGLMEDRIRVTGNMKFDADKAAVKGEPAALKSMLGVSGRFLVAGSTHPGEEKAVLRSYKELMGKMPDLRLLIAPRHPERCANVAREAQAEGLDPVPISKLRQCPQCYKDRLGKCVYILDTIGELVSFYSAADIVFVGGSLVKKGGHNILEPLMLNKPVIFGRYMFNFRDMADMFVENGACIRVNGAQELAANISRVLNDASLSRELVSKASALLEANKGATLRNASIIRQICSNTFTA